MTALKAVLSQTLRGRTVSGLLERLGIEPRRYWILVDLFRTLSERRDSSPATRRHGAFRRGWNPRRSYPALMSLGDVRHRCSGGASFSDLPDVFTLFILVAFLVPETADSLVNPVEGMILAHQPINGATYTERETDSSAPDRGLHRARYERSSGLARHIPGRSALVLRAASPDGRVYLLESSWHSMCCSLFGWLIRFVPVRRLKGIAA